MSLLYFAPVEEGGLAQYALHQAMAIARLGIKVYFLGQPHMEDWLSSNAPEITFYSLEQKTEIRGSSFKVLRRLQKAKGLVAAQREQMLQVRIILARHRIRHLLISYYFEYFAPFWAGVLRKIRNSGIAIGTVVHDPVRDFRVGPRWWHRWSISQAYSFVDVAFVHSTEKLDTGWPSKAVRTCLLPLGLFSVPIQASMPSKADMRSFLNIPATARVILSFGHIRDGKNLDLLIRAMPSVPDAHLLVVGREQSTSQRPLEWYSRLATELGVSERCHWVHEFVDSKDVARYFLLSDLVALLYSADFRSASGVLNCAAQFRLPVICSSGGGPLRSLVERYRLGIWVQPDNLDAVVSGLRSLTLERSLQLDWSGYCDEHDWGKNARMAIQALGLCDCISSESPQENR